MGWAVCVVRYVLHKDYIVYFIVGCHYVAGLVDNVLLCCYTVAGLVDNVLLCCYSAAKLLLDLLVLASPFLQRTSIIHDLLEDVVQGDTIL